MTTQDMHYETPVVGAAPARRQSNIASVSPIAEVCLRAHHLGASTAVLERTAAPSPVRRAPRPVRRHTTAGTRPAATSADRVLRTSGAGSAPGRRGPVASRAVGGGCAHPGPQPIRDDVPTAALVAGGLALAIVLFLISVTLGGPVYS